MYCKLWHSRKGTGGKQLDFLGIKFEELSQNSVDRRVAKCGLPKGRYKKGRSEKK